MKKCPICGFQCDDSKIYCVNCGSLLQTMSTPLPSEPKVKKNTVVMSVLLVISIVINVALVMFAAGIYDEKEDYYDMYRDAKREYSTIEDVYEFYNKYARIVPDDDSGICHRYTCSEFERSTPFWIYNVEAAQKRALPCQECCPDD